MPSNGRSNDVEAANFFTSIYLFGCNQQECKYQQNSKLFPMRIKYIQRASSPLP